MGILNILVLNDGSKNTCSIGKSHCSCNLKTDTEYHLNVVECMNITIANCRESCNTEIYRNHI